MIAEGNGYAFLPGCGCGSFFLYPFEGDIAERGGDDG